MDYLQELHFRSNGWTKGVYPRRGGTTFSCQALKSLLLNSLEWEPLVPIWFPALVTA